MNAELITIGGFLGALGRKQLAEGRKCTCMAHAFHYEAACSTVGCDCPVCSDYAVKGL